MKLFIATLILGLGAIFGIAQELPCELLPSKFPEPGPNLYSIEYDKTYSKEGIVSAELNLNKLTSEPARIIPNKEIENYLYSLVVRLLPHAPESARKFQYSVWVYDGHEPNAFVVPGGIILVSLGMVASAPSDDFLAFMISHEIGHIALRHDTRRKTVYDLLDLGVEEIGKKLKSTSLNDEMRFKYELLLGELTEERSAANQLRLKHESEADMFGIVTGLKAGFNPASNTEFYNKPVRNHDKGWNEKSSHPHNFDRRLMYSCLTPKKIVNERITPEFQSARIKAKQLLADAKPH